MGLLAKVTLLGMGRIWAAMVVAVPKRMRRLVVCISRWGPSIGTLLERGWLGSVDDVEANVNAGLRGLVFESFNVALWMTL